MNYDRSEISVMKKKFKGNVKISKEDASKFIELLNNDWNSFDNRRKTICGNLKNLGENQFAKNSHFLEEIIQNVNDNNFEENVVPEMYLEVNLSDRNNPYIIVASNEMGFRIEDVYSICNSSKSTKKGKNKIGQKGIGFKSIFASKLKTINFSIF